MTQERLDELTKGQVNLSNIGEIQELLIAGFTADTVDLSDIGNSTVTNFIDALIDALVYHKNGGGTINLNKLIVNAYSIEYADKAMTKLGYDLYQYNGLFKDPTLINTTEATPVPGAEDAATTSAHVASYDLRGDPDSNDDENATLGSGSLDNSDVPE